MTMTRRNFLSASAALAVAPALGTDARGAPLPREADIVVIGAGAAGIAAARRIQAANRKVIVIEATGQIGGRCLTDTRTFDVPFDRGARSMHNPDTNPMIKLARFAGLDIYSAPQGQKIRIGRRNARAGETEEFLAALVRTNRGIDEASRGRTDVSCASALPKDLGDWAGTAEFVLGANATGKDLKDVSAMDRVRAGDRNAVVAAQQDGQVTGMERLINGLVDRAVPRDDLFEMVQSFGRRHPRRCRAGQVAAVDHVEAQPCQHDGDARDPQRVGAHACTPGASADVGRRANQLKGRGHVQRPLGKCRAFGTQRYSIDMTSLCNLSTCGRGDGLAGRPLAGSAGTWLGRRRRRRLGGVFGCVERLYPGQQRTVLLDEVVRDVVHIGYRLVNLGSRICRYDQRA